MSYHRPVNALSRRLLVRAAACGLFAGMLPATPALGMRRTVEELDLEIDLPDNWVPIPRAEILEARERALASGASADWTTRAAWQPPPLLRWFTIPHLTLESRPAADLPDFAPLTEHLAGRAGDRTVHSHRAHWRRDGLDLRLVLLSFDDRRDVFEDWIASLRSVSAAAP